MEEGRPSRTAESAALMRGAHQLIDRPLVFEDDVVLRLVGRERAAAAVAESVGNPARQRLRATIAMRSRFAEDRLADAVRRGVTQYVVLGAGLDSFAYRNPFPSLRVFEVDYPASQAWKRRRLEEAGIAVPPSLTFIPVDFERERLADTLVRGGVDVRRPTFVSWLGVTVYLSRDAVLATLAAVATLAPGSAIVFEYGVPPGSLPAASRAAVEALAARAAAAGEPWRTFFEPVELASELVRLGFAPVEELVPDEAIARYFAGRADGLRPGGTARLVHATVAASSSRASAS